MKNNAATKMNVTHHLLPVGGTDANLLGFNWFYLKEGGVICGKSANPKQSYIPV